MHYDLRIEIDSNYSTSMPLNADLYHGVDLTSMEIAMFKMQTKLVEEKRAAFKPDKSSSEESKSEDEKKGKRKGKEEGKEEGRMEGRMEENEKEDKEESRKEDKREESKKEDKKEESKEELTEAQKLEAPKVGGEVSAGNSETKEDSTTSAQEDFAGAAASDSPAGCSTPEGSKYFETISTEDIADAKSAEVADSVTEVRKEGEEKQTSEQPFDRSSTPDKAVNEASSSNDNMQRDSGSTSKEDKSSDFRNVTPAEKKESGPAQSISTPTVVPGAVRCNVPGAVPAVVPAVVPPVVPAVVPSVVPTVVPTIFPTILPYGSVRYFPNNDKIPLLEGPICDGHKEPIFGIRFHCME
jgi:hypothetical protein